jgi:hypothetical protein
MASRPPGGAKRTLPAPERARPGERRGEPVRRRPGSPRDVVAAARKDHGVARCTIERLMAQMGMESRLADRMIRLRCAGYAARKA